jgi:hypothetical protein
MPVMEADRSVLAKAWLESWATDPASYDENTSWITVAEADPELCFEVILEALGMVQVKKDDSKFQTLAAGPLEQLLADHGLQFIERIERLAESNAGFKLLLGVWRNSMPED